MSEPATKLVIMAQRAFNLGCLSHWIQAYCPEFEFVAALELNEPQFEGIEITPTGIVIYWTSDGSSARWLKEQMEVKHRRYEGIPAILIADGLDPDFVQDLVNCRAIDAVILTSDTTKVAAAALRLVLAGGHYMSLPDSGAEIAKKDPARLVDGDFGAPLESVLTTRERNVLELLRTGKPNKIIAYSLGMSLSTAKLHVHNIIRKLKAKNRTEAVIAAGRFLMSQDHAIGLPTKASSFDLEAPVRNNDLKATSNLAPGERPAVTAGGAGKTRSYPGRQMILCVVVACIGSIGILGSFSYRPFRAPFLPRDVGIRRAQSIRADEKIPPVLRSWLIRC